MKHQLYSFQIQLHGHPLKRLIYKSEIFSYRNKSFIWISLQGSVRVK